MIRIVTAVTLFRNEENVNCRNHSEWLRVMRMLTGISVVSGGGVIENGNCSNLTQWWRVRGMVTAVTFLSGGG